MRLEEICETILRFHSGLGAEGRQCERSITCLRRLMCKLAVTKSGRKARRSCQTTFRWLQSSGCLADRAMTVQERQQWQNGVLVNVRSVAFRLLAICYRLFLYGAFVFCGFVLTE